MKRQIKSKLSLIIDRITELRKLNNANTKEIFELVENVKQSGIKNKF